MQELKKALNQGPIVYVTRDLERALGMPKGYQNYHIISNWTPYASSFAKKRKNIFLIKEKELLDTRELLAHPKVKKYIKKIKNPHVLVFKNTLHIEKICRENSWRLVNPPAELANRVEEKISQLEWLGPLTKYLPPHRVMLCGELTNTPLAPLSRGESKIPSKKKGGPTGRDVFRPFILQFNRAHTGSGTILIESKKQLEELKQKFPNRPVRVTKYIEGPAFTNNNVVCLPAGVAGAKKVFIGNINYQITGMAPFTNRPFATIGNDWNLPYKLLSNKQIKQFKQIATDVGKRLAKDAWKGLFGIDVMLDEATGKLYLIEINARQPASTTFESQLQIKNLKSKITNNITTFEAHLASLLKLPAKSYKLTAIDNGAQIILKNKEQRIKNKEFKAKIKNLKSKILNCTVIPYTNTEPESDLLRIQSTKGIIVKHNEFNKIGNLIIEKLIEN